jgi:hypothetical protein
MLQQDVVQTIVGRPPAMYGAHESEGDEPLGECESVLARVYINGLGDSPNSNAIKRTNGTKCSGLPEVW